MTLVSCARIFTAAVTVSAVAASSLLLAPARVAAQSPDINGNIVGLTLPVGIAVNSAGERFVASTSNDTVAVYSPADDSTPVRTLSGMDDHAWGIAFDSNNTTYVTSPNVGVVYVFNEGSTTPDRVILDNDRDSADAADDEDDLTDPFTGISGIAIAADDTVYVANTANEDESVYVIEANAGTPNPARTISGLQNPTGLAISPSSGDIYIGSFGVEDQGANADTVQVVRAGQSSVDPTRTISGLNDAYGIAFGMDDRLYVSSSTTVRVYDATSHEQLTGKTLTGLSHAIGVATVPLELAAPVGGTIFVADRTAGRIRRFSPGPQVEANPAEVAMPNTLVGQQSDQLITVSNSGSADLQLAATPLSMTGATNQYSLIGSTCANVTLAAGGMQTCSFTVRFSPTSRGTKSAEISIASNSPDSPYTMPVNGLGISPVASTSPTAWDYGDVLISSGAASKVFTVSNTGDAPLVFPASASGITGTDSAHFAVAADTCSSTSVAPGFSCSMTVGFDPASVGSKSANLRINPSAPEFQRTYALTGTGTAPGFAADPSSVDFGTVTTGITSDNASVVITNTGNASLSFPSDAVALAGTNAGDFAIASDTCSTQDVAPNATCSVSVNFTPSSTGSASAALVFTDNAADSPQSVQLSGTGVPPSPEASPSPSAHTFQQHVLDVSNAESQVFTVTNTGTSPLVLGSNATSITGTDASDFEIVADTCSSASTAVSATCTITIRFAPAATGPKSASLRIVSNEPASPRLVSLAGSAIATASAPASISAVAGNRYVDASWSMPVISGNAAVIGYQVSVGTSQLGPFVPAVGCAANASNGLRNCRITNVTNGRNHFVRVAAVNAAGTGAPVTSSAVVPRAVAQLLGSCPMPKRVKKVGSTVVLKNSCRTNAGLTAQVTARKTGGARFKRAGNRWTVIMSKRRGTVTITFTAPAKGIYLAFKRTVVFRN